MNCKLTVGLIYLSLTLSSCLPKAMDTRTAASGGGDSSLNNTNLPNDEVLGTSNSGDTTNNTTNTTTDTVNTTDTVTNTTTNTTVDPVVTSTDSATVYPIVLHHGLMDGGILTPFKDIQIELNKYVPTFNYKVSPADTIAVRGGELAKNIDKVLALTGKGKVNIIAHSMGGLDARYVISRLGYGNRVASLTTLSTPHRGTPVADEVVKNKSIDGLLEIFSKLAGLTGDNVKLKAAISNLTESYLTSFNKSTPDNTKVYYQSYAGFSGIGSGDKLKTFLLPGWLLIKAKRGANDGLVPVSSSKWGNYRGQIAADHVDLVGINGLFGEEYDAIGLYKKIIADLKVRGF